jgi:hypothetical protein
MLACPIFFPSLPNILVASGGCLPRMVDIDLLHVLCLALPDLRASKESKK